MEHERLIQAVPIFLVLLNLHAAADEALEHLELQEGGLEGWRLDGGNKGSLPCTEALFDDEVIVALLHDLLLDKLEESVVVKLTAGDAHYHLLDIGDGPGAKGEHHIGIANLFAALFVGVHPCVVAFEDVGLSYACGYGGKGADMGEYGNVFGACIGLETHCVVKFFLTCHNK